MYGKTAIAVAIALAFIASPASALFGLNTTLLTTPASGDTADYVVGNGVVVVFQDIEGTGTPGIGGAQFLGAVAADTFTVEDLAHGDIPEGDDLEAAAFAVSCDTAGCTVFVGAGAVAGTITWTPAN